MHAGYVWASILLVLIHNTHFLQFGTELQLWSDKKSINVCNVNTHTHTLEKTFLPQMFWNES